MIIKDPKKLSRRMMILCLITGIVALAVGIMAIAMKQHLIAIVMGIVAIGQIWNFNKWKKTAR